MLDELAESRALRRVKPVISREVPADTIQILEPAQSVSIHSPPPEIEEVARSPQAIVIDPTRLGRRRRRRRHVRQYRLAQVAVAASMLGVVATITCILLGDRHVASAIGVTSVALALAALWLSWRTRLAGRVQGYALAATLLAAMVAVAALGLPPYLFDSADNTGQVQKVTPRSLGN